MWVYRAGFCFFFCYIFQSKRETLTVVYLSRRDQRRDLLNQVLMLEMWVKKAKLNRLVPSC